MVCLYVPFLVINMTNILTKVTKKFIVLFLFMFNFSLTRTITSQALQKYSLLFLMHIFMWFVAWCLRRNLSPHVLHLNFLTWLIFSGLQTFLCFWRCDFLLKYFWQTSQQKRLLWSSIITGAMTWTEPIMQVWEE